MNIKNNNRDNQKDNQKDDQKDSQEYLRSESARKLAWACRRGMLELDILLQRYLNQQYESASLQEQEDFKKLLQCQDQVLFECLVKREEEKAKQSDIDPDLIYLVRKIRD